MREPFTHKNQTFEIGLIAKEAYESLWPLIQELNQGMEEEVFKLHLNEIRKQPNYYCIGIWLNNTLIACCGYWLLYKFYNGKHLEPDNVGVLSTHRSFGLGKILMNYLHEIAVKEKCTVSELNAYVHNYKAHKFYFEQGYKILGFHFQKAF
jgi:GNAT superfamily N-acetyltransferase